MKKIDPNEIRNAFVWLEYNGHEKEIENLLHNIQVLTQLAMDENYAPESAEWNKRIYYACRQISKLNKAYFEANGSYFARKYNRDSKRYRPRKPPLPPVESD